MWIFKKITSCVKKKKSRCSKTFLFDLWKSKHNPHFWKISNLVKIKSWFQFSKKSRFYSKFSLNLNFSQNCWRFLITGIMHEKVWLWIFNELRTILILVKFFDRSRFDNFFFWKIVFIVLMFEKFQLYMNLKKIDKILDFRLNFPKKIEFSQNFR